MADFNVNDPKYSDPNWWAANPNYDIQSFDSDLAALGYDHLVTAPTRQAALNAFKQGQPQRYNQMISAGDGGFFTGLSNGLQSTANNFLPGGALLNNVVSKDAQKTRMPGVQTVSTIAGLSALAGAGGASNGGMVDPVTGLNEAGAGVEYAGGGAALSPSAATLEYGTAGYTPAMANGGATAATAGAVGQAASGGTRWQDFTPLAGPLIGYAGSKDIADQQGELADKYLAMGEPYRGKLAELYNNPDSFLNSQEVQKPVQMATDMLSRSLSMQGNPVGSGNALQQLQSYSADQLFGRIGQEKDRLAGYGGLASYNAAAPQVASNAINSQGNTWNAIGAGAETLSNIFNTPKKSSSDLYWERRAKAEGY